MPRHSPYALVRLNFRTTFRSYTISFDLGSRFLSELLEFLQINFGIIFFRVKGFSLYTFVLFHFREIVFTLTGKTYFRILAISL